MKYKYSNTEMKMHTDKYGTRLIEIQKDIEGETHGKNPDGSTWQKLLGYVEPKPPYKPGDTLYVRETWNHYIYDNLSNGTHQEGYFYKASPEMKSELPDYVQYHWGEIWKPSIHMPKEAARIWLKVKNVRVERLQEITIDEIRNEGLTSMAVHAGDMEIALSEWKNLWNSTIKKSDLDCYGWDANPWVWVIGFERCEKPEDFYANHGQADGYI